MQTSLVATCLMLPALTDFTTSPVRWAYGRFHAVQYTPSVELVHKSTPSAASRRS